MLLTILAFVPLEVRNVGYKQQHPAIYSLPHSLLLFILARDVLPFTILINKRWKPVTAPPVFNHLREY